MSPDAGAAVVTVVHGRHAHLRAQRGHLARCDPPPSLHVVVAMDDDAVADVLTDVPTDVLAGERRDETGPDEAVELPTVLVRLPGTPAGLPVAAARNAGARAALDAGAGDVIFLDVDCLPSRSLVGDYVDALAQRPEAVVCGPVTYLPPTPEGGWTAATLTAARGPHPARPDPPRGEFAPIGPALFWSLSFAVRAATWARLGGFHEGYVGYGGEDTDLGFTAAAAGVAILFVGGADAYHQHHPVSDPPVEHLDDILRNAGIFRRRHGVLPMAGWLTAFREAGLTTATTTTDGVVVRRRDAIRLLTVPARHPYLDAALPPTVRRVDTARVVAWEPDPLLTPDAFECAATGVDVVHVHFSYEHLEPDALCRWLDTLERHGVPLVVTVHDLRNPHVDDPDRHVEQLRLLVASAARVITLTDTAAARCVELFGRPVDVVPHPTLLDTAPPAVRDGRDVVLVPLKAMRANVLDAARLVRVVADAAPRTRVLLDPSAASRPDFDAVRATGERADVDVVLAGHVPHDEVVAEVAAARAVFLPYAFGTHSGWIELARDVGTAVIAPGHGAYADQWAAVRTYRNDELDGPDAATLSSAVAAAVRDDPPAAADRQARLAQRDLVRATHESIYRSVLGR